MGEAALLPRLVRRQEPDAALGSPLTRNIALMLLMTVPATAVLGLAVLALDVAGIGALAVRVIRSGAPRPRREPLGREETGPA